MLSQNLAIFLPTSSVLDSEGKENALNEVGIETKETNQRYMFKDTCNAKRTIVSEMCQSNRR